MTAAQPNTPFDSRAYYLDDAGRTVQFVAHPLDQTYLTVPGPGVPAGMLPPQDLEIRAALGDLAMAEVEVLSLGLIATYARLPSYRKAQAVVKAHQDALAALVASSPEHQAAMRRIVESLERGSKDRAELERYVKPQAYSESA